MALLTLVLLAPVTAARAYPIAATDGYINLKIKDESNAQINKHSTTSPQMIYHYTPARSRS